MKAIGINDLLSFDFSQIHLLLKPTISAVRQLYSLGALGEEDFKLGRRRWLSFPLDPSFKMLLASVDV
ncbi:hypothetical protein Leryth_019268 [Lithospermum erythrorhizon]|nr:hypothetical protein Leryth_019268 [Lithospermum erythrorhizon]